MHIDDVSKNIVTLALYLNENHEGLVSEIWLAPELIEELKEASKRIDVNKTIKDTRIQITKEKDSVRKQVLSELLTSLKYQIDFFKDSKACSLSEFYKQTYGYELDEVSDSYIAKVLDELKFLENQYSLNRHLVLKRLSVTKDELVEKFKKYLENTKKSLPEWFTHYCDFNVDTVDTAPWAGFNSHKAPFKSTITLNTSSGLTVMDLKHMAMHEAFGGHHTELSYKDNLLINEQKGEHGLVLVYSPMTFISEGIAEATFDILGFNKDLTPEERINYKHMELTFVLMNKTAFMFTGRNASIQEIRNYLTQFDVGEQAIKNILDFVTDKVFGKYAPVYHSAKKFIIDHYNKSQNKEEFLPYVFKSPCTLAVLNEKFGNL